MSLPLIVRRRAEHDMAEAGLWYESRRSGAGIHFIRCAVAAISLIARQPEAGTLQFGLFRRILVSRFPFTIISTALSQRLSWCMAFSTHPVTPKRFAGFWSLAAKSRYELNGASRVAQAGRSIRRDVPRAEAYRIALGRPPAAEETTRATAAAKARGLQSVCWALLNSTEFVYVR